MSTKLSHWFLFSACLLAVAFSITRYGVLTDRLLIALRFSLAVFLSVLLVRGKLNASRHIEKTILDNFNRWYQGR